MPSSAGQGRRFRRNVQPCRGGGGGGGGKRRRRAARHTGQGRPAGGWWDQRHHHVDGPQGREGGRRHQLDRPPGPSLCGRQGLPRDAGSQAGLAEEQRPRSVQGCREVF